MAKYRIVRIKGYTCLHRVDKLMFTLFGHEFWRTVTCDYLFLEEAQTWVKHEQSGWVEFEQSIDRRKKTGLEVTPHDTVVKVYE